MEVDSAVAPDEPMNGATAAAAEEAAIAAEVAKATAESKKAVQDGPVRASGVGLIIPPPEIRSIVDITASFVAKNGQELEAKIRLSKATDAKYNFLKPGDAYHTYYLDRIRRHKSGEIEEAPAADSNGNDGNEGDLAGATSGAAASVTTDPTAPPEIVLVDEPPAREYICDAPLVATQDMDIVKLTAQFVAKNGSNFLNQLIRKEHGNYQFEFLMPNHSLFTYFTAMVEQYRKLILPKEQTLLGVATDASTPYKTLDRVRYKVAWDKKKVLDDDRVKEETEKRRVAYEEVDWHDFLIVETIEFTADDKELPPPVTKDSLGGRMMELERMEREKQELKRAQPTGEDDTMDVEMDMDNSDDEQEDDGAAVTTAAAQPAAAPLPEMEEENIVIRSNYDPKSKKAERGSGDQYLISPLTGESILASRMAEHLRIGLLDPKWRDQKDRLEKEMAQHKEAWALGQAAAFNKLKDIASRRTDVFGSGDRETAIGETMGGKNVKAPLPGQLSQKSPAEWAASASNQPMAASIAVQAAPQVHAPPPVAPPPVAAAAAAAAMSPPSRLPAPPPAPPAAVSPPAIGLLQNPYGAGVGLMGLAQANLQHHQQQFGGMPPPPMSAPVPAVVPPPVEATMQPPAVPEPEVPAEDEPTAKRSRVESKVEQFIAEKEFIKQHPDGATVTVNVAKGDKYNMNGQSLKITVEMNDKVSDIKAKINAELEMPANKQKLQLGTVALANTKTAAFYNMTDDTVLSLSEKTRGGRK